MEPLAKERCAACRPNSPRVTAYEIVQLKPQIPDWNFIEKNGVPKIERTYEFPDFKSAIAFTNSVGEAAETEGEAELAPPNSDRRPRPVRRYHLDLQ